MIFEVIWCCRLGVCAADWVRWAEFYPNPAYGNERDMNGEASYTTWMCLICGFIYDEELGIPEEGIPSGTRWEDVPMNWVCPECGARKTDFEMVEF